VPYIETNEPRVLRDTESKALLQTDTVQLERRRAARRQMVETMSKNEAIEHRLRDVDTRLTQYEHLLVRLIEQVSALVERPAQDRTSSDRE